MSNDPTVTSLSPAPFGSVSPAAGGLTNANINAVSTDFEAVFLTQMLSAMFSGDQLSSYFGGGTAGDVYKGYLMDEYGKLMASTGGIGIASQVKQELLKLQEVHQS